MISETINRMSNFTQEKIEAVWKKAKIIEGHNSDIYRQDLAGAWIQRDKFGKEESFGWEIDHMFPESKGGTDNTENLQPLQWENNRTKSDSFPGYSTSVSSNRTSYLKKLQNWKFTDSFIVTLKGLYPNNQHLRNL